MVRAPAQPLRPVIAAGGTPDAVAEKLAGRADEFSFVDSMGGRGTIKGPFLGTWESALTLAKAAGIENAQRSETALVRRSFRLSSPPCRREANALAVTSYDSNKTGFR